MNIGHVYIIGQIGSSLDEDGNVKTKGVELFDVVEQVEDNGEVDKTIIHINSPGGFVDVGNDIANFITMIPNCFTSAESQCASIATKVFLSVPLQNRTIEKGTEFMIHNPFLQNISGDADTLKSASEHTKIIEEDLEKFYSKATGLDKGVISSFMASTLTMTAEQCVKMKFASQITEKEQARAVALIYNEKQTKMKKPISSRLALAMAVIAGNATATMNEGREAKAMTLESDKGILNTPYEDLMVGDEVTIDGEPAPNDTYTLPDGMVITVVDGLISEIVEGEAPEGDDVEALKAQVLELTTKNGELEAKLVEANDVSETAVAQLEALANARSNGTVPQAQARFKAPVNAKTGITKEGMAERKASYKK